MNPRSIVLVGILCVGACSLGCHSVDDGTMTSKADRSSLDAAVREGDVAGVRQLLSAGVSPDAMIAHGNRPLQVAVAGGQVEVAKVLLDAGANPVAGDNGGNTPLMTAANKGNVPLVDLMLAKSPPLDAQNDHGKTALIFASEQQSTAIVRRLVAAGASTSLVDYKGRGPAAYAQNNPAVLDALRGGSGQVTTPPPAVRQRMDAQTTAPAETRPSMMPSTMP